MSCIWGCKNPVVIHVHTCPGEVWCQMKKYLKKLQPDVFFRKSLKANCLFCLFFFSWKNRLNENPSPPPPPWNSRREAVLSRKVNLTVSSGGTDGIPFDWWQGEEGEGEDKHQKQLLLGCLTVTWKENKSYEKLQGKWTLSSLGGWGGERGRENSWGQETTEAPF